MVTDRLHETRWDVIPPSPFSAHMHMALDEMLLEEVIAGARHLTNVEFADRFNDLLAGFL